jgi:hypothetical protein
MRNPLVVYQALARGKTLCITARASVRMASAGEQEMPKASGLRLVHSERVKHKTVGARDSYCFGLSGVGVSGPSFVQRRPTVSSDFGGATLGNS